MEGKLPNLVEPRFGYAQANGLPYTPTVKEVLSELICVLNVFAHPNHLQTALGFIFQTLTMVIFLIFCYGYVSGGTIIFIVFGTFVLGTIYNTFWYHRYCSDMAFEFAGPVYPLLMLWTNPLSLIFREENYAIPHRQHHQRTDRAGDPYGPHLGYVGNFFSTELTQRLNPDIPQQQFVWLVKSLAHIGLYTNSYDQFRKTGSVERLPQYAARLILSQSLWCGAIYFLGGVSYVAAYYAAIFIVTFLIRDFNWRGHGGSAPGVKRPGWEFHRKSNALNQYFYGYIASEWHDNHHRYITSAKNGFLPGQLDVAFAIIKLLHRLGIVKSYINAEALFRKQCLLFSE